MLVVLSVLFVRISLSWSDDDSMNGRTISRKSMVLLSRRFGRHEKLCKKYMKDKIIQFFAYIFEIIRHSKISNASHMTKHCFYNNYLQFDTVSFQKKMFAL